MRVHRRTIRSANQGDNLGTATRVRTPSPRAYLSMIGSVQGRRFAIAASRLLNGSMPRGRSTLLLVAGLSLVALGAVNTAAGWTKMDEYRARKHAAIAAGGDSVRQPFSGTKSILDPSTDAQLLYEAAAIKYEYYRIVRRGGFYFLGIGAALLIAAALRGSRRLELGTGTNS